MKAIKQEPGKPAVMIEVENDLHALQREVGGYIQAVAIERGSCVLCDEDGRIKGLEPNCIVDGIDYCGTILVVGTKGEEFTDCQISLPEWRFRWFTPVED